VMGGDCRKVAILEVRKLFCDVVKAPSKNLCIGATRMAVMFEFLPRNLAGGTRDRYVNAVRIVEDGLPASDGMPNRSMLVANGELRLVRPCSSTDQP